MASVEYINHMFFMFLQRAVNMQIETEVFIDEAGTMLSHNSPIIITNLSYLVQFEFSFAQTTSRYFANSVTFESMFLERSSTKM